MLIIGIDLCNEAILSTINLDQSPEFGEVFCGINTTEVVALGWCFSIKATNSGDSRFGTERLLSQPGYQRLTYGSLIQDKLESSHI
ncbi:hypothetical protein SynA1528_00415 [Synechococcus sp. A15-28]|nr:hypothetical protein SynA1528_00415 [Synechococcus sp. A15-28]